jgi:hypothetical protein
MTHTQWITDQPEAAVLCEILRKIARREIITPSTIPALTSDIVAYGVEITKPVRVVEGRSSRCQVNVGRLWKDRAITEVSTGWGLSDGVWHEHTWGVDDAGIVETAKIQDHYYGVTFAGERAEGFLKFHRLIH